MLRSLVWGILWLGIILSTDSCGSRQLEKPMLNQSEQKITSLTEADQQRLCEQRAVVERYLSDDASRQKYQSAAGKLGTVRALLEAKTFKPTQTYELQCLGIVLGDAFVQELKMEWVVVEDQDGRDPAVRVPGKTIILYPLTMISKRVERGEKVDVFEMFNGVAAKVEEMKKERM